MEHREGFAPSPKAWKAFMLLLNTNGAFTKLVVPRSIALTTPGLKDRRTSLIR